MDSEPVYRQAEQEWKDFVDKLTDVLIKADSHIAHLPPKDLIHRIYRDVRDFLFILCNFFILGRHSYIFWDLADADYPRRSASVTTKRRINAVCRQALAGADERVSLL